MSASLAISTAGLSKFFYPQAGLRQTLRRHLSRPTAGRIAAVEQVSLDVQQGELFGLLGPNGAGKTTLVKLLCTLLLPDSGTATVNGCPLSDEDGVRSSVGLATGQERSFYPRLSGRDNLAFFATLHGLASARARARIEALAGMLEMGAFLDRRFDSYSSGMKQRLDIARALLHQPPILFLDEPTKSLDPLAAARLRETIRGLAQRDGHTVVLVTHQLPEAEALCDRVAIMQGGRILAVDQIAHLRQRAHAGRRYRLSVTGLSEATLEVLRALGSVHDVVVAGAAPGEVDTLFVTTSAADAALAAVIERIVQGGGRIVDVALEEPPLAEAYRQVLEESDGGSGA